MKLLQSRKRIRAVAAVLVLAAVVTGVVLAWRWYGVPVHHFSAVVEGKVYRSGQPGAVSWRVLREHYHIATVISLREDAPEASWATQEVAFCEANNIQLVRVQLSWPQPTKEEMSKILTVMGDPERQPVLIHCEAGSVRTGVAVAAYRIVVQGWSVEDAVAEAEQFVDEMQPGHVAFLRGLERRISLADGTDWTDTGGIRQ